jgi:asparagine synthase (glutamine-hydrolysing)
MLFSSSISALANQINATVDLTYCASGIKFGFFEGNGCRSPFKEIKYVSPGSFVKFSLGEIISMETTQWYSLSDEVEKRVFETSLLSNYEIEDRIRFLLDDAVKIRLHCDVPVAVSLSGGVDSSSIAAIASAYTCGFKAFSYSSPNMNKSEGPFVERFINEKNIPIEYIYPDYNKSELGDLFDRTCRAQEAPFLGLSIMAQQEIYRVVKSRGYRVLLGGQGGDEIFAGYRKFILIALKNSLQSRNFESFFNQLISLSSVILYGIQDIGLNVRQSHRYFKSGGRTISLINCLPEFSEDLITNKTLRERQILDIQNFSLPSLLRYEDRNSMSNSIESRLPFMDYRLVEFALSISDALKIKSGYGKWILRKSMSHYVPKFILENRNKRGFDVSQNWIIGGVGDRIRDNLLSNLSKTKEFLHDGTNLEIMITKENLKNNTNLLNEAMMLNFLIEPVKNPL